VRNSKSGRPTFLDIRRQSFDSWRMMRQRILGL
jgi:hypothetical protein